MHQRVFERSVPGLCLIALNHAVVPAAVEHRVSHAEQANIMLPVLWPGCLHGARRVVFEQAVHRAVRQAQMRVFQADRAAAVQPDRPLEHPLLLARALVSRRNHNGLAGFCRLVDRRLNHLRVVRQIRPPVRIDRHSHFLLRNVLLFFTPRYVSPRARTASSRDRPGTGRRAPTPRSRTPTRPSPAPGKSPRSPRPRPRTWRCWT